MSAWIPQRKYEITQYEFSLSSILDDFRDEAIESVFIQMRQALSSPDVYGIIKITVEVSGRRTPVRGK